MLRFRLIAAALILTPLIAIFVADYSWLPQAPGALLFPLCAGLVMMGSHELCVMMAKGSYSISYPAAMVGSLLVWLSCGVAVYYPLFGSPYPADCPMGKLGWPLGAQAVAVIVAFVFAMRRYGEDDARPLSTVASTVMPSVYVALPLSFFVWLRLFRDAEWGMVALISVVVVVKMGDVGAYAIGRTFGKAKLAPKLSPGKTVAGGVGAVATSAIVSVAYFALAPGWMITDPPVVGAMGLLCAAIYGVILSVTGMVGDLAESLIKRDLGCKDSGCLPGLGGVLDILDSLVFAAPIAYLCWVLGLVGP